MDELRYTLVAEGSSDAALLPILDWLLIENGVRCPIQSTWADLRVFSIPNSQGLADRIRISLEFYPCDLLFVHRDADTESREKRAQEIKSAVSDLPEGLSPAFVCVIPVRMQETWLLIDEAAIKNAAGNRHYAGQLKLPPAKRLERIRDAKNVLSGLLKQASDLNKRRQRRFPVARTCAPSYRIH